MMKNLKIEHQMLKHGIVKRGLPAWGETDSGAWRTAEEEW